MNQTSSIILFVYFLLNLGYNEVLSQNPKYEKWKLPSYFRGYNILNETPKSLKDFVDLKNAGANFALIGNKGFYQTDSPYSKIQENITETDSLVSYARQAGLNYAITVRGGPGRRDVYLESIKQPNSTIWTNSDEQKLYASMITEIVDRYAKDSLFVGISPIMEPNPLSDPQKYVYFFPHDLDSMMKANNIDVNKLNQLIVDSVRTVNKDIPILLQSVAYSCPEFYSLMSVNPDPYIVYEFHSYRPHEYTNAASPNSVKYPDNYISYLELSFKYHDKSYIKDSVFSRVRAFQQKANAPVILGEFGLWKPQNGGPAFLKDITDICKEFGWHFAYWDYRNHLSTGDWNYESFGNDYWLVVQNSFYVKTDVENRLFETSPKFKISQNDKMFMIEFNDTSPNSIDIYNILGEKLNSYDSKDKKEININLQYLRIGMYFIKFNFNFDIVVKKLRI